jgi:hypothetical protein
MGARHAPCVVAKLKLNDSVATYSLMAPDGPSMPLPEQAEPQPPGAATIPAVPCTMGQFLLYFLRLGTFGFGGPIALRS